MTSYGALAEVYDHWTREFNYTRISDFVERTLGCELRDAEVLDACCGTGTLAYVLGQRGAHVAGIDRSSRMIEIAKAKVRSAGLSDIVKLFQADVVNSALPRRKFDLAMSTFDSMNYLSPPQLKATLSAVARSLKSGGIFVFDINSRHKLQNVFGNTTYSEDFPDYRYIWRNRLDASQTFIDFEIEIFRTKQPDGSYLCRDLERHRQFIYDVDDLVSHLEDAGFLRIRSSEDYSELPPRNESLRITLIGRVDR